MTNIAPSQAEAKPAVILSQSEIDAARDAGGRGVSGRTALIDVIKIYQLYDDNGALVGSDMPTRDCDLATMIKVASYEGAMRDGCHVSIDEAKRLLNLSSSDHKTAKAEEKRTADQDRVYSLAKANWTLACDACGLPKAGSGGPKGGGKVKDVSEGKDTLIEAFHVPMGLGTDATVNLFVKFADAMRRALASDKIKGDAGDKLRTAFINFNDDVKDAMLILNETKGILNAEEVALAELAEFNAWKAKKAAKGVKLAA